MLFKRVLSAAAYAGAIANAQSLTSLLSATPELSTLTTLVSSYPDLLSELTSATNITILAPTNKAFAKLPKFITSNADLVKAILTYHVLPEVVPASAVPTTGAFVPTLLTNETYEMVTGGQVVEGKLVGDCVKFVSGFGLVSDVIQADVEFDGGIVHIIDRVLTIPQDIAETALASHLFALVGALQATGLTKTVESLSDVTVFAPTNHAFAEALAANPDLDIPTLTKILEYHVINGTVAYSTTLMDGEMVPTVEGSNVTVSIDGGKIFIDKAQVIKPDVLVENGVVHVINQVLIPPDL